MTPMTKYNAGRSVSTFSEVMRRVGILEKHCKTMGSIDCGIKNGGKSRALETWNKYTFGFVSSVHQYSQKQVNYHSSRLHYISVQPGKKSIIKFIVHDCASSSCTSNARMYHQIMSADIFLSFSRKTMPFHFVSLFIVVQKTFPQTQSF